MSSSESDDDFIAYGTALEPLEEDEIPSKKPCLLEDQVVTDKQNRRRFHGAFTGGFSAGFFNTVGSLEGWVPSSFKSSRSKKQEIIHRKPEDFMDEEDLSEFGIAPIVLKAKQDYTNDQGKTSGSFRTFRTLGTYVLQDLLKPARETVGIKLLKKMGWKPGQGVGPRLSKKEKENAFKIRQKTYGCQLPSGLLGDKEEVDQNSDSEWDYIEFAPNDYEPFLCEAKNNFSGVGYEGLDKKPVLSSHQVKKDDGIKEKNQKFGFSSQAFGVGAFEEEDEDIYAKDDMSRYDFVLGNDQSGDLKKSTNKNLKTDDEGVLDGFVLQRNRRVRKKYCLPKLPENFKYRHKIRRSRFDQPPSDDKANSEKRPKMNSEDRRKLIEGFDEDALEAHKQKEKLTKELISNVKISENRFRPFASNLDKQERYENYLKLVTIGQKERLSDLQPLSMTNYDREREIVEFEKTALLFKPLTGGMEDRFLTASQPDDLPDPPAVVEKCTDDDQKSKKNKLRLPTRSSHEWFPAALLCTRFNVCQLKKETHQARKKNNLQKERETSHFQLFSVQKNEDIYKPTECYKPYEKTKEKKPSVIEPNDQNLMDQNKTDLFKAIFLESDDDDKKSDEEAIEAEKSEENQFQDDLLFEEKLINSKRNLSPPSGIFKNIDLELLSGGKRMGEETEKSKRVKSVVETVEPNSPSPNLVYGPKIPEKIPIKTSLLIGEEFKDDGVWVEKELVMRKSTKNKNKKHKKALHKSKHKHKKHKR